jgi:hypothetical protein
MISAMATDQLLLSNLTKTYMISNVETIRLRWSDMQFAIEGIRERSTGTCRALSVEGIQVSNSAASLVSSFGHVTW